MRSNDGVVYWCDLSLPDPGRISYLRLNSANEIGVAAKRAESRKHTLWQKRAPKDIVVVPLVMETTGMIGDEFYSFLKRIEACSEGPGRKHLLTRLSVTLAKFNVKCVREAGHKVWSANHS